MIGSNTDGLDLSKMVEKARQEANEKNSKLHKEARDIAEKIFQESKEQIAAVKEKV